jgi:hypothetical protein
MAACGAQHASEAPAQVITIGNHDSDGSTLRPAEAAIKGICDAAFEQADALNITGTRQREMLADECNSETQEAIANDFTGKRQNLVGDRVGVTLKVDEDGYPVLAVVQQKPNSL